MYGLILILVMTFMPYGFWGFFKKVAGWRPWNEYGRYRESGSAGAYFDQRLRQPVLDRLGRNRGTWSAQTPVSPDPPLRPEEEP
jgi:hypothetical protein